MHISMGVGKCLAFTFCFFDACFACWWSGLRCNLHGSPGKHPIPSKQPESCDDISCFVNGDLLTEVLPLWGCLTSLKASGSPSLQI